jgi:hypothetical protein
MAKFKRTAPGFQELEAAVVEFLRKQDWEMIDAEAIVIRRPDVIAGIFDFEVVVRVAAAPIDALDETLNETLSDLDTSPYVQ